MQRLFNQIADDNRIDHFASGGFENMIVLSDEFYREVTAHSIPTDLEAAKALSSAPAALDLYMWLSYRCFTARGQEPIPIFGEFGLVAQLGSVEYVSSMPVRGSFASVSIAGLI